MTAIEAKQLSEASSEVNKILKQIEKAAKDGWLSVDLDHSPSIAAKTRLKELGYSILEQVKYVEEVLGPDVPRVFWRVSW